MNIGQSNFTPNFGARIKINKDMIKATGLASSAGASAVSSAVGSIAGMDMPPAQNFVEKAIDSAMYSGMFGSGGTASYLISKAAEYAKKAEGKLPS